MAWLLSPASQRDSQRVAQILARTCVSLGAQRIGALIVVERETGLEDAAETGVMLHADLSPELLHSIFSPHAALHDGAVIVRGERIVAAGVVLPLSETSVHRERYGTRHRAALGITEQTDAVVIVVSEESGAVSLVERGRILRTLDEDRLRGALTALLRQTDSAGRAAVGLAAVGRTAAGRTSFGGSARLRRLRPRPPAPTRVADAPAASAPGTAAPAVSGPASRAE
jgi:hypothetical protein